MLWTFLGAAFTFVSASANSFDEEEYLSDDEAVYGIAAAVLVGIGMGLVAAVLFEKHVVGKGPAGHPSFFGNMIVPMTPRGVHRSNGLHSPLYTPPPGGYSHAVHVPLSPISPSIKAANDNTWKSKEGESPSRPWYSVSRSAWSPVRWSPSCSPTIPPSLDGFEGLEPPARVSPTVRISLPGARVTVNTSPSQIEGVAHLSPRRTKTVQEHLMH